MGSIAVRIENGSEIIANALGNLESVKGRNHQKLSKCALAIHTHTNGVAAQMAASGTTITAIATSNMALTGDAITNGKAAHFLAHLNNFAHILMADMHGYWNCFLCPLIPFPNVDVGTADRGFFNLDHHIVVSDDRLLYIG